jgi:sugar/nucleoside kinase (ribokinase family)
VASDIIVAGHICLDVIPTLSELTEGLASLLEPGKLVSVGEAITATGGAVPNTGLCLRRLGLEVELMGKVGDDMFGSALLSILRSAAPEAVRGMKIAVGEPTSYTIVLSPPGIDRIFLHCPGTNHTFCADDIDYEIVSQARLFHFGYPPLMRRIYQDPGELAGILRRVKELGLTTSLDLAKPDPSSEAGRVAWRDWLSAVLPFVDVFLPSLDEITFALHPDEPALPPTGDRLSAVAEELIRLGAAIVVLKLGDQGLYLRTTTEMGRLARAGRAVTATSDWLNRELQAACFRANLVGTTGSGDCTIGGFLANLLMGSAPEAALTGAVAVGGFSVEASDAVSGVPKWEVVRSRVERGWPRLPVSLALPEFERAEDGGLATGPRDRTRYQERAHAEAQ